jgi:tetratricopeptide (TPR) repeat protein
MRIVSFEQAIKIKPDYHDAWSNRGNALRKLERYEEAIASYDQAIKFKPDFYQAWCNRGFTLNELEKYEEAMKNLPKQLKPNTKFRYNKTVPVSAPV